MILTVKVGKSFGYLASKGGHSDLLRINLELFLLLVSYQEHSLRLLDGGELSLDLLTIRTR
jgi:hypothetical protein